MLANLCYAASADGIDTVLVSDGRDGALPCGAVYATDRDTADCAVFLHDEFKKRSAARRQLAAQYGDALAGERIFEAVRPLLIVISDFGAFLSALYEASDKEVNSVAIVESVLKNGGGMGVVFAAVMNRQFYTKSFFRQAAQIFASYKSGVHLGGHLDLQKIIESTLPLNEQTRQKPPEQGYALNRSRVQEVFIPPHRLREDE